MTNYYRTHGGAKGSLMEEVKTITTSGTGEESMPMWSMTRVANWWAVPAWWRCLRWWGTKCRVRHDICCRKTRFACGHVLDTTVMDSGGHKQSSISRDPSSLEVLTRHLFRLRQQRNTDLSMSPPYAWAHQDM